MAAPRDPKRHRPRGGKPSQRRARPPRDVAPPSGGHEAVHLSDSLVRELESSARPGKGDIMVKVFADAMAAYEAGDIDEAIRLGDQAKHIALRSTSVREFLGLAFYRAGRWKEAALELSAFRRMSGSSEQNHVIADCYRATGKPEKAVELCDEIRADEVEPLVYYEGQVVAAAALADMGRVDEAIARLEALQLEPKVAEEHHVRVWYVLGDLLERKGRYTQARVWFRRAEAADPELTDAGERAEKLASHD